MAMRKYKAALLTAALLLAAGLRAQDTQYPPNESGLIPGPASPADAAAWREDLGHFRMETLIRLGYDGAEYERPALKWTQSSFVQPQMMAQDRYFYDPVGGRYTVDRYLRDLQKRFGGIDSVLIWPTYPNLGVDDRNQFDLIRDMPGGIAGLRAMIEEFHRRGVRVLFPYNPWDLGTRPESTPDWETVARLMASIGADGVNGDTLYNLPRAFRVASDATGHPLAFEPQLGPQSLGEELAWDNLSWDDWIIMRDGGWQYPFVPMVSADKWVEPRHMVNVCDRWVHDRTDDLQHAFFNGEGYESWENIWGIWNPMTDRDAEALRRVSAIERAFPALLTSSAWVPYAATLQYGLFASKFPGKTQTLWTMINRNHFNLNGAQIQVAYVAGTHYYDLWHGKELSATVEGSTATLSFPVGARGFGAVLAASSLTPAEEELLARMHGLSARTLASYSHAWHFLPQHLVPIQATAPAAGAPAGMVRIPAGDFLFKVSGIEIEGGNEVGVDVQYPWEDSPRRHHAHEMHIHAFYMDRYPVTNAEFKKFLDATHYLPRDAHNFLRDWKDGNYPQGWADKPVTWVSLEDARAYAAWAGKRLPHEWEWQYAAQGTDGRLYPWGNEWDASAVPPRDSGRFLRPPAGVNAYPKGSSPFGVTGMVGNVWQWTDEFRDEHTRAAILRGGSTYQSQGSRWYFPQAYRLDEHGKYLLMAPSIDRSGTIGFRCVVDAP
jgi:formylglycine-generating enzyme required for sulfatase activity